MFTSKNHLSSVLTLAILLLALMIFCPASLQAKNVFEGDCFSLEYPADWISREEPPQGMILEFVLLAPEELEANEFASNINVMVEELQQEISLEKYSDLVLMQVENMLKEFALVEQQEIKVDDRGGVELTYSGIAEDQAGDYNLTGSRSIMIEDEQAYIVTLIAEKEVFSDYQGIYNNVVDSLIIYD